MTDPLTTHQLTVTVSREVKARQSWSRIDATANVSIPIEGPLDRLSKLQIIFSNFIIAGHDLGESNFTWILTQ